MLGNHHLKSHILHGINMMSHQHIVRTLRQSGVQINVLAHTANVKHSLEGTRLKSCCRLEGLVIPKGNDIATVPRISLQLCQQTVNDIVLLNNRSITLTNRTLVPIIGRHAFNFPVIPIVDIVFVFKDI